MNSATKIRDTKQRRAVLAALHLLDHPTADSIYQCVRQDMHSISMGTVYRNLGNLEESGEIASFEVDGAPRIFDISTHTHYHTTCTFCGSVHDVVLEEVDVERLSGDAGRQSMYNITGSRIEFYGICAECKTVD